MHSRACGTTVKASGAEVAESGVAHVDPVAGCARPAPAAAAAPRSPHHIVRSILSPDPRFVTTTKIDDLCSRRKPVSHQHRTPRPDRPSSIVGRSQNVPNGIRRQPAQAARSPRRTGALLRPHY